MDLAERLRRLGYVPTATPSAPSSTSGAPLESVIKGDWRETPHGRCFVASATYPLEHVHGGVRLRGMLDLAPSALALLGRGPEYGDLDFRQTVFLDTETTGLTGGTGTYVFLVGVGYLDGPAFRVDQFFMSDYDEERAMLAALAGLLSRFGAVVTFNGKSFDLPLLDTRYAMWRQRPPLGEPLHLDVMFPARRLWRERVGSCGLGSLEENVLGVERSVDVPGWLIPSVYFQFVRDKDPRPLGPVFAHNEQDILSLLALTVRLARQVADPLASVESPVDLYATGRMFESAADLEQAIVCYEQAMALGLPREQREKAACRLGLVYKRLRQDADAVDTWRSLVSRHDCVGLLPFVELAKHLEHRERDYAAAASVVERALARVAPRPQAPWRPRVEKREQLDLERRLNRLHAKLRRSENAETKARPGA
ncbi:MAG: ribonuclease H-like domain-containing protein [Chloroflexota bacterium]